MAQQLTSASIAAPGFYGLNTQESSITLEAGFALQADNCVIDRSGRLGARKGWEYIAGNGTGTDLKGAHEFVDIDGTRYLGAWSDTSFYLLDSVGDLQSVTYSGSNTITDDGWQAATLNDAAYLFQRNYKPIYFSPTSGVLDDIENVLLEVSVSITSSSTTATVAHTGHGFSTGQEVTIAGAGQSEYNGTFSITVIGADAYTYTLHNSTSSPATGTVTASWQKSTPPQGNTVLSAYGRLWTADTNDNKTTVYWSNLLDGTDWDNGSAGSIDLSSILVKGNDEIVAIGAQAGRLIVFCKENIVIFGDTDADQVLDPVNMRLVEVLHGTGCIARDSVQNTGSDIIFLSRSGLQSLGRLIQEKSQPMRDLSKNIRDEFVRAVANVDPETIKSVYSAKEACYLLLLPEYQRTYYFDMRTPLQDGAARVTIWDNQTHSNMLNVDGDIYFTNTDGLAQYKGYTDNGDEYNLRYYTNYLDFGNSTNIKYLKRVAITVIGGHSQEVNIKAGYDYTDTYQSYFATIAPSTVAEYGISEYNSGVEYSTGTLADNIRVPVGGGGNVVQAGFEATIDGFEFSVQKLDIYIKQGRVY